MFVIPLTDQIIAHRLAVTAYEKSGNLPKAREHARALCKQSANPMDKKMADDLEKKH